jgi:hypothetical protein
MLNMFKPEAMISEPQKKVTSERKIAANRENSKRSSGPHDTRRTRNNARKHGLRAANISMLDSPECKELLPKLLDEKKPVGVIEAALVDNIAAALICVDRANAMEANFIDQSIEYPTPPPLFKGLVKPRLPPQAAEILVRLHQRYGTTAFNRFLRTLHELERQQRMRKGEIVQSPAVLDVNLTVGNSGEKPKPEAAVIDGSTIHEGKLKGAK